LIVNARYPCAKEKNGDNRAIWRALRRNRLLIFKASEAEAFCESRLNQI